MEQTFRILSILLSVLLVAAILLQVKGTGGGLFGASYGTFRTRRGFERILFRSTIGLIVLFVIVAVLSVSQKSGALWW